MYKYSLAVTAIVLLAACTSDQDRYTAQGGSNKLDRNVCEAATDGLEGGGYDFNRHRTAITNECQNQVKAAVDRARQIAAQPYRERSRVERNNPR